jgi:hypothetical protein
MALSYSATDRLPHWARTQWEHDAYKYESKVWFGVQCVDGPVQVVVTMPEQFAQPSPSRRRILQDMIEQLTVQLAKVTLEET